MSWVSALGRERTNEELAAIRKGAATAFGIDAFTCDGCLLRHTCEFAFDAYNTNEDCLAEK